ncbi:MAG: GNAT family N-acetyltransferase [Culicoidibacterales bacterium]
MIRQATLADLAQVRPLVFRASQLVFADALSSQDLVAQEQLFNCMYTDEKTKFSYQNTLVYEVDHQICGCIIGYPAELEARYNATMATLVGNGYQFPIEAIADSYYIDSLAVDSNYEGRGIAKQLIQAVSNSTSLPVSLLVEVAKPQVQAYYERLGFQANEAVMMFGTLMYPMIRR